MQVDVHGYVQFCLSSLCFIIEMCFMTSRLLGRETFWADNFVYQR